MMKFKLVEKLDNIDDTVQSTTDAEKDDFRKTVEKEVTVDVVEK